jgi:putative ABC transport system permease protein
MIRHITTLIWNQKRKHLGLSFEILFSFLVLFAVFSFCAYHFKWFFEPMGFSHERVWNIYLDSKGASAEDTRRIREQLTQQLQSYPEIQDFAYSYGNIPFSFTSNGWGLENGSVRATGDMFKVSDDYFATLQIPLVAGRYFGQEDDGAQIKPILLTQLMKEKLFGDESAIGKTVKGMGEEQLFHVVGVVNDYRYRGDFGELRSGFFIRTNHDRWLEHLLVRTTSAADAAFEAQLIKDLSQIATGWSVDISYLDDMREDKMLLTFVPILIFAIIAAFLIFNVALGLFGVLWQNISRRREEIGIRRAIGATRGEITFQFVGEILVLCTFSIAVGVFFAIQFPLLHVFEVTADVYIGAMLLAILAMYLLVFVCAFFPSAQAARLAPAVALRDE